MINKKIIAMIIIASVIAIGVWISFTYKNSVSAGTSTPTFVLTSTPTPVAQCFEGTPLPDWRYKDGFKGACSACWPATLTPVSQVTGYVPSPFVTWTPAPTSTYLPGTPSPTWDGTPVVGTAVSITETPSGGTSTPIPTAGSWGYQIYPSSVTDACGQ
jgi:hypothetical protein